MTISIIPKLSPDQEKNCIILFLSGKNYIEISNLILMPYNTVNRFMTSYKRKTGLLKPKKSKAKVISVDEYLKELAFLRTFYLAHVKQKSTQKPQNAICIDSLL